MRNDPYGSEAVVLLPGRRGPERDDRIGVARGARTGIEVPQAERAPAVRRDEVKEVAAQRDQLERRILVELLVAAGGVAEVGAPTPELLLRPPALLERGRRQGVVADRVEREQAKVEVRVARACALNRSPSEQVRADGNQGVPAVAGRVRAERDGRQQLGFVGIEAPETVGVVLRTAADDEIVARRARVLGHLGAPFAGLYDGRMVVRWLPKNISER